MRNYFEKSVSRITTLVVILLMHCSLARAAPPTDADCTGPDPFPDPDSCTSWYQCFPVDSAWTLVHFDCPTGGMYDVPSGSCVAGTCENPTTTTELTTVPTTTEAVTTTVSSTVPDSSTVADSSTSTESSSPAATSTTTVSSSSEGSSTPADDTTTPSTPTETTTTATIGPPTFVCTSTGFFVHPTDPTKYYQCVLIGAQFYYYIYTCPPNSCFQSSSKTCVVGSCSSTTVPTTTTTAVTTPPVTIICNSAGQYPFPGSCTKYYRCILLSNSFVYYVYECPPGSYFNAANGLCSVGQCPSTTPTTATTTTTPATTTTALATTTTAAPDHPCVTEGYFADPTDCQAYYRCILINAQMYRYMYRCPATAYWNNSLQGCIVGTCPTAGKRLVA